MATTPQPSSPPQYPAPGLQPQPQSPLQPQEALLSEDEEKAVNVSDFLQLCLRCWKWFAASVAVCLCLGVIYVLRTPKQYTRTAQVMVQDDDAPGGDITSALSNMGLYTTSVDVSNELLAFKSPALVGDVITRLGLRASYVTRRFLRPVTLYGDSLALVVSLPDLQPDQSLQMVLEIEGRSVKISDLRTLPDIKPVDMRVALGDTVVTPVGRMVIEPGPAFSEDYGRTIRYGCANLPASIEYWNTKLLEKLADKDASVIDFTITDTSIKRADDFLNTLIEIYNEKWVEQKRQMAVATSDFINERLKVIEKELGGVDSDIAEYKGEHLMPDVAAASAMYMADANENLKKQLEVQTQIDITRFLAQYLGSKDSEGKLLPANLGIDNQGIVAQITEYNTLQLERDQLLEATGPANPLVKERDTALHSIRSALASSLATQARMLDTQLASLVHSDRKTNAKIASSPSQAKYLLSVERQQKVKEELYLFLLQKREENELSMAFTPGNTRVITPPMGPLVPSAPVTRNVLLICLVIGLMIPAGILFLGESLNTRVRNREDLARVHAPFVGEIPERGTVTSRWHRWRRRWREIAGKESRIELAPDLVVKPHGNSVQGEAFRMLRSNLDFISRNGRGRVAMVTSFNPGSGKSFISLNLGATMAIKRNDIKVLIIDLDLRRASLSKVVGRATPGIAEYLSESTDDLASLPRPTEQPGLWIMPVGTIPPNPSELLYSPRLQQALAQLRQQYDFIILDCPPTDIVADATIITPLADMTVFVARAGLMDRRLIPDLNRFYDTNRFNNMMVVLNGTVSLTTPYRRYAYHNYYTKE